MMISPPEVKEFNQLIEPYLNGQIVLTTKYRFLTKPGDNYGSTMLGVTVRVQNEDNTTENLEIVAKLPPSTELLWEMFRPERTFVTESSVYTEMVPAFQQFEKDIGLSKNNLSDVIPKYYGARISLDKNSKIVDKDAVLILENLYSSGYKLGIRDLGFDYQHTLFVLKNLARFHAIPIALRLLQPKIFDTKCRPYIKRFHLQAFMTEDVRALFKQASLRCFPRIPNITDEMVTKLINLFNYGDKYAFNMEECKDHLFSTIAHCDFWVNNMMIQYDSTGQPINIKILDFQIAEYESLVHDLIFFLYSSVQSDVLDENYEEFIKFYYEQFIEVLKATGCPTEEYSIEKFLNEIDEIAPLEFSHIILMLKVLFLKRDVIPNLEEYDPEAFIPDDNYDENYYIKLKNIVDGFIKNGWVK